MIDYFYTQSNGGKTMAEDFSQYSNEELINRIKELKKQLNDEKYGLYFDRKKNVEIYSEGCTTNIPLLFRSGAHSLSGLNRQDNIMIEGDNFHALMSLSMINPEEGMIDIIYIDPPYNTGNKDFIYNDKYVDIEDGYRHTKWLNFMEKRLRIARDLLKEEGVIFISIDDNEVAQLKMLCDSIFGELNFIGLLPRVTKKSGKGHSGSIAKNHDYVLVYSKDISCSKFVGVDVNDGDYTYEDEYVSTRGKFKLNQPLDYDSLWYNPAMDYPLVIEGIIHYPGGSKEIHDERHLGNHKSKDWVWRWGLPKFNFGYKNGFVVIKDGKNGKRIYTKTYLNAGIKKNSNGSYQIEIKDRQNNLSSITFTDNSYSNDNAKKELDRLGITFDFPKPSSLIKTLISIVSNKYAVVADFFAGSGTTGQAVLELNNEDGGNRKFILVTNNEGNIMTDVCYPRIKTVITGIRPDGTKYSDGIPANVQYFKTAFIEDDPSKDQAKYNLVEHCNDLLCILEDTFILIKRAKDYYIYKDNSNNKLTAIYFDYYKKDSFIEMTNEIKKLAMNESVVYLF